MRTKEMLGDVSPIILINSDPTSNGINMLGLFKRAHKPAFLFHRQHNLAKKNYNHFYILSHFINIFFFLVLLTFPIFEPAVPWWLLSAVTSTCAVRGSVTSWSRWWTIASFRWISRASVAGEPSSTTWWRKTLRHSRTLWPGWLGLVRVPRSIYLPTENRYLVSRILL